MRKAKKKTKITYLLSLKNQLLGYWEENVYMGAQQKAARDDFCDLAKGLAALDVIIIHTAFWSGEAYSPDWLRNIVLFAEVPFLIFLSGYSSNYVHSIKKQFRSLLLLYLKWCLFVPLFWIVSILLGEDMTIHHLRNFVFLAGDNTALPVVMGSTWFWPIYFFVVFLGICVVKKIQTPHLYIITCLTAAIYLGCVILQANKQIIKVVFYLFMYMLGNIVFSIDTQKLKKVLLVVLGICVCVSIPAIVATNATSGITPMAAAKSPPIFWYAAYSLIAPCLMMLLKNKNIKCPLLSWMGKNCFLFYLAQGISSSALYFVLPYLKNISWGVKFLICLAINILLAFLIVKILLYYYIWIFRIKNYFHK